MTEVLNDTELCCLLSRPNTHNVGGGYAFYFLMLLKYEAGTWLETDNV